MKNIYPKDQNPFKGKKIKNFKQTVTYPNDGDTRFRVQLDKNGQVCEIRQSYAQIIKDTETKKRFVKIVLGDRPRSLFDRIKGRPMALAMYWIDEYIANLPVVVPTTTQEEEA